MDRRELFLRAHQETKKMKEEYSNINYIAQLGIFLKTLYSEMKMNDNEIRMEKKGYTFIFQPSELQYNNLTVNYKVEGKLENKYQKAGFYHSAKLDKNKKVIRFMSSHKIDGMKINGVGLDIETLNKLVEIEIKMLNEKEKLERELIEKLVAGEIKVEFVIHGCDYKYYDISLKNISGTNIDGYEVLNKAIKKVLGEYMSWDALKHSAIIKDHKGTEPFELTLKDILYVRLQNKQKKENKINALIQKAKETGERQLVSQWSEECDDKYEECDVDIVQEFVNENGEFSIERSHTY